MAKNVKSKVKYNSCLSEEFTCQTGVRQEESLSPFRFAIYVNDIEEEFIIKGANGIDVGYLKLFLLLYDDDIVIFSLTLTLYFQTHQTVCRKVYKKSLV